MTVKRAASKLIVKNHGPLILSTNFWEGPEAAAGTFLVSLNGGAFRLLVPPSCEGSVSKMATAKGVAVSRGPWPSGRFTSVFEFLFAVSRGPWPAPRLAGVFEFLFDDGSSHPFYLHFSPGSFSPGLFDRWPRAENVGQEWIFSAWTRPRQGTAPCKALERPCRYRIAPKIPDLRPWTEA